MARIGFGLGQVQATSEPERLRPQLEAILAALDGGIRVFDSAPNYAHGLADCLLGRALELRLGEGLRRSDLVVCTKVGYPAAEAELEAFRGAADADGCPLVATGGHCLAPAFLRAQLERSLQRLGLEAVDILFLHNPEEQRAAFGPARFEARLAEALAACEALRREGRVAAIGIACSQDIFDPEVFGQGSPGDFLDSLLACARQAGTSVAALQVPFSLSCPFALWPKGAAGTPGLLDAARASGVPVFASAALGRMQLPLEALRLVAGLFDDLDTPARLALQFARSAAGVDCALFGSRDADHVRHLAALGAAPAATI